MILKTKVEILNWLEKNDRNYQENMEKNAYELINIHEVMNQSLLNELIKKDNLPSDYFENLKLEGHQYILNVIDSVNFLNKKIKLIPIQFYHVAGNFDCNINKLTSLKGCPQYVGGDFLCFNNKLTSLQYSPQHINGHVFCHYNQLNSLEYFPEKINGNIFLNNNEKLLRYKNQSNDIQNMSDNEFLSKEKFSFWKQFHLQEKAIKEEIKIISDLNHSSSNYTTQFNLKKI